MRNQRTSGMNFTRPLAANFASMPGRLFQLSEAALRKFGEELDE